MTNPIFITSVLVKYMHPVADFDVVESVYAQAKFDTREQAEEFVASKPKMLRLKIYEGRQGVSVNLQVQFCATKGNQSNETGIKRTARAMELLNLVETENKSLNTGTLEDLRRFLAK